MGTRSLVHVKNSDGQTLVTMYRQMDGYPTGIGQDILDALNGGNVRVVNGYTGKDKNPEAFNGIGCLAAYLVGALKSPPIELKDKDSAYRRQNTIGNVYIMEPDAHDCGEEYTYTISEANVERDKAGDPMQRVTGEILLKVVSYGKQVLYDGPLSKFIPKRAEKSQEES